MNYQNFVLEPLEELSDKEIMKWGNKEFAEMYLERSYGLGASLLHIEGWQLLDLSKEEKKSGLVRYCERIAWIEYWLGVHPQSKQIVMLEDYPGTTSLRIRLAQQVIDEVKHQRIWSKWVQKYGGNPRIEDHDPGESVWKIYNVSFAYDNPVISGGSVQATGEAILTYHLSGKMDPKDSISYTLFPADLRQDIAENVIKDEPRHVAIGRDLIIKFANTPEIRRELLKAQRLKMQLWLPRAVEDMEMLGAKRVAPLPKV